MAGGVEYQVTKVDPTDPETKGMVYQVNKVSEEVAATLGGKVYRARIIKDPTEPTVAGKVYQIVIIADPDDPSVKGKVYNAILTGDSEVVVVGPAVSPLSLPDAIADSLSYVKAFGGTEQRNLPDGYIERQYIYMMADSYLLTDIVPTYDGHYELDFQTTTVVASRAWLGARNAAYGGLFVTPSSTKEVIVDAFGANDGTDRWATGWTPSDNTRYKFVFNNKVATFYQGDTVIASNTFVGTDTTTRPLAIKANNDNGTIASAGGELYVYGFKAWNAQGELVANYIPAVQKGTVPVVGFYDTVSKTFKTATAGTFAAGGEAVPTPDTPMDIVSNNGVLKARHQSGLPLGYTALEYIQSSGSQYIDTGRVPNNNDIVEQKFQKIDTSTTTCAWYGSMPSSQTITPRIGVGSFSSQGVGTVFAGTNYTGLIGTVDTNVHTLRFQSTGEKELTYTFDGVTEVVTAVGETINMFEPAIELTSYLFARHGTNGVQVYDNDGTKIYYHREYLANGTLVLNMVPVKRNSDNVLGMYDLVSGQFFTNQGTGTFTAGTPVSDPVEIYTDGTVETIEDTIGNTATVEMLLKVGDYQDVQEILAGDVTRKVGVLVLDGTEDWVAGTGAYSGNCYCDNLLPNLKRPTEGKSPAVCTVFPMVEKLSDFSVWKGYISSNPVGRVNLWYNDTVANFKQYLAAQYANGTPVIVVYPLATETTESVAGQTLQVTDGDNTLEITQASLNNLELEAEYEKEG